MPAGLAVVRGILVVGPYAGGDSRELYREVGYGEFMHMHDFAFLGAQSFSSHAENYKVMQNALKQLAADSKHPELVNAAVRRHGLLGRRRLRQPAAGRGPRQGHRFGHRRFSPQSDWYHAHGRPSRHAGVHH